MTEGGPAEGGQRPESGVQSTHPLNHPPPHHTPLHHTGQKRIDQKRIWPKENCPKEELAKRGRYPSFHFLLSLSFSILLPRGVLCLFSAPLSPARVDVSMSLTIIRDLCAPLLLFTFSPSSVCLKLRPTQLVLDLGILLSVSSSSPAEAVRSQNHSFNKKFADCVRQSAGKRSYSSLTRPVTYFFQKSFVLRDVVTMLAEIPTDVLTYVHHYV